MQYNRKMINGVVFLEEQADYLLLLGKEGLYTVQAENDHWNVHYTLPGESGKTVFKYSDFSILDFNFYFKITEVRVPYRGATTSVFYNRKLTLMKKLFFL